MESERMRSLNNCLMWVWAIYKGRGLYATITTTQKLSYEQPSGYLSWREFCAESSLDINDTSKMVLFVLASGKIYWQMDPSDKTWNVSCPMPAISDCIDFSTLIGSLYTL